jgi:hypothetical protein
MPIPLPDGSRAPARSMGGGGWTEMYRMATVNVLVRMGPAARGVPWNGERTVASLYCAHMIV